MKKLATYKNIRKSAEIFGLPISLFALMMMTILASLMVIIFSFSFWIIIGLLIFNAALYVALIQIVHHPQLFQISKVFPKIISNKRNSGFNYEQD
jgi:type IV secretory pathway VirB3-like protein